MFSALGRGLGVVIDLENSVGLPHAWGVVALTRLAPRFLLALAPLANHALARVHLFSRNSSSVKQWTDQHGFGPDPMGPAVSFVEIASWWHLHLWPPQHVVPCQPLSLIHGSAPDFTAAIGR